jgi:hypothetical protein
MAVATFDNAVDAVNGRSIFMKVVIAQLVFDKQYDQDAAGHADGKPGDIDYRDPFVSHKMAERYLDVIPDHMKKVKAGNPAFC